MDEPLLVEAEQILHQRRAAARWRDDEDRLRDGLASETGKENVIQRPAQDHKTKEQQEQSAEKQHVGPASEAERLLEQREPEGPVGSRALTIQQAIIIAAIFEFCGAYFIALAIF